MRTTTPPCRAMQRTRSAHPEMRLILAIFALISLPVAAFADPNLDRNLALFPEAMIAPPIPVRNEAGKLYIPGWTQTDHPDAFFEPDDGSRSGLLQISRENDGYTIDSFFDELLETGGLNKIERPTGVEVEAFRAVFGTMVAAVFGEARYSRKKVVFFADLHGPDTSGIVVGTLIFAPRDIFESWDGVLMPLVKNGYVSDPSIFENRAVMRLGDAENQTTFYAGMVNTKIMSEYGALGTLSAGAIQAAQNASTIAGCASASNCSISYDGAGNAIADHDQN